MKNLKLIIGLIMIPFAYSLFVLDRIISVVMPNLNHKPFTEWLNTSDIKYSLARLFTIVLLRFIVWITFNI